MRDARRIGGGRGLCGGAGKIMDGAFSGRPQSFRHQRRPVDERSPERGGMMQDGGTRGGTFIRDEIDHHCRESQGWSTTCSSMPERNGKDQGKDSPKQAGSCWFNRHSLLVTRGTNLYPPGGCRVVFFWRYVCYVCFVFVFFVFVEAAALRSIVLRSSICMRLDSHHTGVT